MFGPVIENVCHLLNTKRDDAIVRALPFGGEAGYGETSVVGVGDPLDEFGVLEHTHLAIGRCRIHRATTSELAHRELSGIGECAEDRVPRAGDVDADRGGLSVMRAAVDRQSEEAFEGSFCVGD